jgi:hypothetical protein
MATRQCKGSRKTADERVLEVDFEIDRDGYVGERYFHMSLDGKVVDHKDLIALLGPEAAQSLVDEAVEAGIDAPY